MAHREREVVKGSMEDQNLHHLRNRWCEHDDDNAVVDFLVWSIVFTILVPLPCMLCMQYIRGWWLAMPDCVQTILGVFAAVAGLIWWLCEHCPWAARQCRRAFGAVIKTVSRPLHAFVRTVHEGRSAEPGSMPGSFDDTPMVPLSATFWGPGGPASPVPVLVNLAANTVGTVLTTVGGLLPRTRAPPTSRLATTTTTTAVARPKPAIEVDARTVLQPGQTRPTPRWLQEELDAQWEERRAARLRVQEQATRVSSPLPRPARPAYRAVAPAYVPALVRTSGVPALARVEPGTSWFESVEREIEASGITSRLPKTRDDIERELVRRLPAPMGNGFSVNWAAGKLGGDGLRYLVLPPGQGPMILDVVTATYHPIGGCAPLPSPALPQGFRGVHPPMLGGSGEVAGVRMGTGNGTPVPQAHVLKAPAQEEPPVVLALPPPQPAAVGGMSSVVLGGRGEQGLVVAVRPPTPTPAAEPSVEISAPLAPSVVHPEAALPPPPPACEMGQFSSAARGPRRILDVRRRAQGKAQRAKNAVPAPQVQVVAPTEEQDPPAPEFAPNNPLLAEGVSEAEAREKVSAWMSSMFDTFRPIGHTSDVWSSPIWRERFEDLTVKLNWIRQFGSMGNRAQRWHQLRMPPGELKSMGFRSDDWLILCGKTSELVRFSCNEPFVAASNGAIGKIRSLFKV